MHPGLDARGDLNVFRYNTCVRNLGAGVRIGGHKIGDKQYGEDNEVYENILQENDYAGIKIMVRAEFRGACVGLLVPHALTTYVPDYYVFTVCGVG